MNNPNCGTCGMLNSRGFCSLTACRFPVVNKIGTWQKRILANKPKQTNADRIRAMTDEELAEWLEKETSFCCDRGRDCRDEPCEPCLLDWLKSPVEVVE